MSNCCIQATLLLPILNSQSFSDFFYYHFLALFPFQISHKLSGNYNIVASPSGLGNLVNVLVGIFFHTFLFYYFISAVDIYGHIFYSPYAPIILFTNAKVNISTKSLRPAKRDGDKTILFSFFGLVFPIGHHYSHISGVDHAVIIHIGFIGRRRTGLQPIPNQISKIRKGVSLSQGRYRNRR